MSTMRRGDAPAFFHAQGQDGQRAWYFLGRGFKSLPSSEYCAFAADHSDSSG